MKYSLVPVFLPRGFSWIACWIKKHVQTSGWTVEWHFIDGPLNGLLLLKSSRLINQEGDYCESSYAVVILSIDFCPFCCTKFNVIFTSKRTLYSRDAMTLLCADVIMLKAYKMTMEADHRQERDTMIITHVRISPPSDYVCISWMIHIT